MFQVGDRVIARDGDIFSEAVVVVADTYAAKVIHVQDMAGNRHELHRNCITPREPRALRRLSSEMVRASLELMSAAESISWIADQIEQNELVVVT